ncbi:hypothetical protein D6833_03810 [Candidatus Parcubacteria bacterium]|nr:MAG: hypothetical protein D6833_03810 [Candidatus Parcubacteria bacterium]
MEQDARGSVAVVGLTILAVVLSVFWWFTRRTPEDVCIEFVIPDGFRGVFFLELDPDDGTSPEWRGNTAIYYIPRSGVLKVSSFDLFEQWHTERGRYSNGQPLTADESISQEQYEQSVLLRDAFSMSDGVVERIYFVVGTEKDLMNFRETNRVWWEGPED